MYRISVGNVNRRLSRVFTSDDKAHETSCRRRSQGRYEPVSGKSSHARILSFLHCQPTAGHCPLFLLSIEMKRKRSLTLNCYVRYSKITGLDGHASHMVNFYSHVFHLPLCIKNKGFCLRQVSLYLHRLCSGDSMKLSAHCLSFKDLALFYLNGSLNPMCLVLYLPFCAPYFIVGGYLIPKNLLPVYSDSYALCM